MTTASLSVSAAHAQVVTRDVLRAIGIDVPASEAIVLTDGAATGALPGRLLVDPGQITFAAEQHRLITGEVIDSDALIEALPWKEA